MHMDIAKLYLEAVKEHCNTLLPDLHKINVRFPAGWKLQIPSGNHK